MTVVGRTVLGVPAAAPRAGRREQAPRRLQVQRIARISRVVSSLERSRIFYEGLGFRTMAQGRCDAETLSALGLAGADAEEVMMRLGMDDVALVRFAARGRPYPPGSRSDDLWFQHLAIVVSDMDAAYARLCSCGGWSPISEGGPQLLPPSNGCVRAFKFRDPDGHPLELIWFPPGQGRAVWHRDAAAATFLGIDHSALAIASTPKSGAFYRALGLHVNERSLNKDPAQGLLDGLPGARVRVTSLRSASETGPGLELLSYQPAGRPSGPTSPTDLLTDWVTLAVVPSPSASPCAVRDPDGHLLVLVDQGSGSIVLPA
jgi:catechol 2,3-dioxygenase-like lactoylglutathione lyase family enzyme